MTTSPFNSFRDFYPYYLAEHAHPTCRKLHFFGSCLVLACVALTLKSVAGFGVNELARAFLSTPSAIAQSAVNSRRRPLGSSVYSERQ